MGSAFKNQGKLEEALDAYTKAISIKPDYAEAYYNMGSVFHDQEARRAIDAYTKAILIKPGYAKPNNMEVFSMIKETRRGNGFTNAISLKPDWRGAITTWEVFSDQGKLEEAIDAYTKAISLKLVGEAHPTGRCSQPARYDGRSNNRVYQSYLHQT